METEKDLAPPSNIFIDPGYQKSWAYQHLYALQYVCEVVTVYCLQPKDVCLHAGAPGLKLIRTLLESGRLRVVLKEAHLESLEKADLSEIPLSSHRHEVKALTKELIQRSRYEFSQTLQVPSVRALPNDFTDLSIEFGVKKVVANPLLNGYFNRQAEKHRRQLPEFMQPDILPRDGLVPLPQALRDMEDAKLRALQIPYAFFGDWLAMHQADVHIPLLLHPKWNEWYWRCWEEFAVTMPSCKWPRQVFRTARPVRTTPKDTANLVPAMAELVRMIVAEARLTSDQFRKIGGSQLLQNDVLPHFMNCYSSFASLEECAQLEQTILHRQKKRLNNLFHDMERAENRTTAAWTILKGVLLPTKLFLAILKLGSPYVPIASSFLDGAYFSWRHINNSRRDTRLRAAARENGIWLGLLVNDKGLEAYRRMARVER